MVLFPRSMFIRPSTQKCLVIPPCVGYLTYRRREGSPSVRPIVRCLSTPFDQIILSFLFKIKNRVLASKPASERGQTQPTHARLHPSCRSWIWRQFTTISRFAWPILPHDQKPPPRMAREVAAILVQQAGLAAKRRQSDAWLGRP